MKHKTKNESGAQKWFKYFTITFLIFTLFFTGIQMAFSGIGEVTVFTPGEADEEFKLVSIVDAGNPFFETFKDSKRINVLLLGLNPPLTDTIMLASFDAETPRVDLISVPRDTYYPREGHNGTGEAKINAAYLGKELNTAVAVSDVLQGIPIHYYALAEFEGIEKVVDAMGGVPVNVPFHMRYIDNTKGHELNINIPKGEQVLMGKEAIEYLRFRKTNVRGYRSYKISDIDRQKAQQEFLRSAFQQSIGHLPSVVTSVFENVKSNIDLKTALKIAAKATDMDKENIYTHVLPGRAADGPDGLSYFFMDAEATKEMITNIYIPPATTEGAVTSDNAVEE